MDKIRKKTKAQLRKIRLSKMRSPRSKKFQKKVVGSESEIMENMDNRRTILGELTPPNLNVLSDAPSTSFAHKFDSSDHNKCILQNGNDVPTRNLGQHSDISDQDIWMLQNEKETEEHELMIEHNTQADYEPISGRRIVDINYIFRELQNFRHNSLFDCKASYFDLVGEKRTGLTSIFKFKCNMCKELCIVKSEKPNNNNIDLNLAATSGIIASGIGYYQFEELCSAMNVPVFGTKYYSKLQAQTYDAWEKTAIDSMQAAAEEESQIAIAEGRISNGIPVIDVFVDGSWCARSYGSNYKASSGTAAIIGRKTKKVLFMGVKNKYCLVCARAEKLCVPAKEHICFKNYEGSSSSMEAAIIVQGFKSSLDNQGLIYGRMIADGDASTYSKILDAQPYASHNITVEKIECRNHVLRNFCKKLRGLSSETKYPLAHRKTLTVIKIMTMRKAIINSIKKHNASTHSKQTAISMLHKDIINSLNHAYGDHRFCEDYYCAKQSDPISQDWKSIQNSSFLFRINAIVSLVASKSRSLIENVDTNTVECYNNVIAKFIGGKRINFAQRQGYQGRCAAAVVSFNDKSAISSLQNQITNTEPEGIVKNIENKRTLKRKKNCENPTKKKRKVNDAKKQNDYGQNSAAPDMLQPEFDLAKAEFLENLKKLTDNKSAIERSTVLQRDSSEWLEIRKKLVTASNFGSICKRQAAKDTAPLVKNLLYKKNLANVSSIAYGIEHENQALLQLQQQENCSIEPCGLFIDENLCFIGASPDGLVGEDKIVEVKCPKVATKKGLESAIKDNKIQILKYNKKTGTVVINKNSNWFYQVQGQLHVTQRNECIFGIWAGENERMHVEYIVKDDEFWKKKIEPKLVKFYQKCLLPELVDPRHIRGMAMRKITLE